MTRYRFIILSLILMTLTACKSQIEKPAVMAHKDVTDSTAQNRQIRAKKLPDENVEGAVNYTSVTQQVYGASEQHNLQPDFKATMGEKLNFWFLDQLDNKRYAWWILMNKKHATPGIAEEAKPLLTKYNCVYIGDKSKKIVYLTFDEGYENGFTPEILDTLKKNDVKALFFVTGAYLKSSPGLIKRMIEEGHQVGNHSINHPSLPSLGDIELEKELYGLEKRFVDLTGKGFKYMRPPKGEYSERVLAASQQLGYKTVFWSFAYDDFNINNQKGAEHAYKIVMDNLHNGAVLLLHAVSKDNAEALDRIIKDIKAQGYEIKPFDL